MSAPEDKRMIAVSFHQLQRAYLVAGLADIDPVDAMWASLSMDCPRADLCPTPPAIDPKVTAIVEALRAALNLPILSPHASDAWAKVDAALAAWDAD